MGQDTITGHCVCKRYVITIPRPTQMNLCHCVDCRRWAGSMYSAHLMAPPESVQMQGPEPRMYTVKGVDGQDMTRAWCDGCGSGLYIKPGSSKGGPSFFKAGLFNPGDVPPPTMETFTKDMESWEIKASSAKHFEVNGKF